MKTEQKTTEKTCMNCKFYDGELCLEKSDNECNDHGLWEPVKTCGTCRKRDDYDLCAELNGIECVSDDYRFWKSKEKCATCIYNDEMCSMCDDCEDGSLWKSKELDTSEVKGHQNRGKVLKKALDIINGERQDMYGNPENSFALIAKYWNAYLNDFQKKVLVDHGFDPAGYKLVDMLEPRHIAEMMILFKVARMSGQKTSLDNYSDAAGYAGIAGDMI